jgi:hypothetical protein
VAAAEVGSVPAALLESSCAAVVLRRLVCGRLVPADMLKTYRVTFRHCVLDVMAYSVGHAIRSGLELAGPGAEFMSCIEQSD